MPRKAILLSFACLILLTSTSLGQEIPIVQWSSRAENEHGLVKLFIIANISPGWHVYSQFLGDGGPLPTHIAFDNANGLVLKGPTTEKGNGETHYDETFEIDITSYSGQLIFMQKAEVISPVASVNATVIYMACNDTSCLPEKMQLKIIIPPGN